VTLGTGALCKLLGAQLKLLFLSASPRTVAPQIGSTILAQAAGVPTLPWSGSGVAVAFDECRGVIPEDVYDQVPPRRRVDAWVGV
jgi:hypothetical protein